MNSTKFFVIFNISLTFCLINYVRSENEFKTYNEENNNSSDNHLDGWEQTSELNSKLSYVATTPKIVLEKKKLSRYEQGLEDYDEAMENANKKQPPVKEKGIPISPLALVFNFISAQLVKSIGPAAKDNPLFETLGLLRRFTREAKDNVENLTENSTSITLEDESNTTRKNLSTFVGEGRQTYIKGDPLNGYYDFVITEGSYKFWVVFQLFTSGLLIYSTLAAIYYSKVNPLVSDYDYVDYLSRSFKDRSLDVEDDATSHSAHSYLTTLRNDKWVQFAAYGFEFAMNAIDKIPQ